MAITYNYKNLSFPVSDETKVFLEVEYVSDGNSSFTNINTPGPHDPELDGEGSVMIDIGKNLRDQITYINTNVDNFIPQVERIKIRFKLNGELIQEHSNLKEENSSPLIVLHVNFPRI